MSITEGSGTLPPSNTEKNHENSIRQSVLVSRHRDYQSRKLRLGIIVVLFVALAGLVVLTNPGVLYFINPGTQRYDDSLYLALGLALLLTGFSGGAMLYLQTGFRVRDEIETRYLEEKEHIADHSRTGSYIKTSNTTGSIDTLESREPAGKNRSALEHGISDYDAMVALFLEQARREPREVVWADLLTRAKKANRISHLDNDLLQGFEQSRRRLVSEVESLGRRGNFNLVLGMVISAVGLTVLATVFLGGDSFRVSFVVNDTAKTVAESPTEIKDAISFAISFLPRLTFALVIELFAFFFLRLYRTSLNEIKYFQNEITNIESKSLALRASLLTESSASLNRTIASLVDTERNHILQKGQSTIDLEKAKIEASGMANIAKSAADLIDKIKLRD